MKNDLKGMREYLTKNRKIFIYRNNTITDSMWNELVDIYFSCSDKSNFIKCFEDIEDKDKQVYKVERKCSICGKLVKTKMSKSGIVNDIKHKGVAKHNECIAEVKKKEQEIRWAKEQVKLNNIKSLFDPAFDVVVNKNNIITIFNNLVGMIREVDKFVYRDFVKNIEYKDFLKTPYWKIVSYYKKYSVGFKCELCGKSVNLQTHHLNYDRHFFEHEFYKKDLECLCDDCHTLNHNLANGTILLKKKCNNENS